MNSIQHQGRWPPCAELRGEMTELSDFESADVSSTLPSSARVYGMDREISASDIIDTIGNRVFDCGDSCGRFYFIDLEPNVSWAHKCLYVLMLSKQKEE